MSAALERLLRGAVVAFSGGCSCVADRARGAVVVLVPFWEVLAELGEGSRGPQAALEELRERGMLGRVDARAELVSLGDEPALELWLYPRG